MSDFYCTQCGQKNFGVWRKRSSAREPGHLKKLYCLSCNKEVNCVEIKPNGKYRLEDFILEYEYGNFDEEGNRKTLYKTIKRLVENGIIQKEKTFPYVWNPGSGKEYLAQE